MHEPDGTGGLPRELPATAAGRSADVGGARLEKGPRASTRRDRPGGRSRQDRRGRARDARASRWRFISPRRSRHRARPRTRNGRCTDRAPMSLSAPYRSSPSRTRTALSACTRVRSANALDLVFQTRSSRGPPAHESVVRRSVFSRRDGGDGGARFAAPTVAREALGERRRRGGRARGVPRVRRVPRRDARVLRRG